MAYACPVCATPQADAGHLADHLAFTAIRGDDAHEEWLDSTVEEWGAMGTDELAAVVTDHAAETEFPIDLDAAEATGHTHDGADHDHGTADDSGPAAGAAPTDEVADVLEEARELTRQMDEDNETE